MAVAEMTRKVLVRQEIKAKYPTHCSCGKYIEPGTRFMYLKGEPDQCTNCYAEAKATTEHAAWLERKENRVPKGTVHTAEFHGRTLTLTAGYRYTAEIGPTPLTLEICDDINGDAVASVSFASKEEMDLWRHRWNHASFNGEAMIWGW